MTIKEFNTYLNSFKWACCYFDTKWHINTNLNTWAIKYKTLTYKQFLSLKVGSCWDYVNTEYHYLKDYYSVKCYYLELENYNTHYDNFLFESAFKSHTGIYYRTENNAFVNKYNSLLNKDNIYTYTPLDKELTCDEFMNYIYTHD